MKIKIVNNCKRSYRPDPLKITNKILERIPDKFLDGIGEIFFFDESNDPVVKYIVGSKDSSLSRIEFYMGGFANKGTFSISHFNILLITSVTDHIVKHLQPISDDEEILSIKPHRINRYEWMYLGIWSPFLMPLKMMNLSYRKFPFFRKLIDGRISLLIKDTGKFR